MKRYHITLGAKTTAGGTVTTASSMCSIDGVRMAVEGDTVSCPVCKTDGVIVCDGPRLSEKWNGKQAALHDDLCVCKCVPAPRLVASQKLKCQYVHTEEGSTHAGADGAWGVASRKVSEEEKLPLRLLDEVTHQPYRNRPYKLALAGGRVIDGTSDEDGLTQPLTASERSAVVAWHVSTPVPV